MGGTTNYSLSPNEVRQLRVELSSGKFATGTVVSASGAAAGSCTVGAINGDGTNAIFFSLTAGSAGCDSAATFTVNPGGTSTAGSAVTNVSSTSTIQATYSMYDTPSEAQAGGTYGRIVTVGPNDYIKPRLSISNSEVTYTL